MKSRLGVVCVLTGLVWSCVSPLPVDSEGTATGGSGNHPATGGSGTAGSSSTSAGGSDTVGSGGASSTGGATNGAVASCPFDAGLEYDPAAAYPFCNGDEKLEFGLPDPEDVVDTIIERCRGNAPGVPTGAGRHNWTSAEGSPDGEPVDYCLCTDECAADSECPAGDSGDAAPSCIEGFCHLTCDDDQACPNGMVCTEDHESEHHVCMWPSRGDGCDTTQWPNVTQPEAPVDENAICPFDGELDYDPAAAYPFCNGNETLEFGLPDPEAVLDTIVERCRGNAPGVPTGAGRHTWTSTDGSPDGEPLDYCSCTIECEADTDCAAGDSGDAVPSCIDHFCHLTCDDDEACPNGMTCTERPDDSLEDGETLHRVCMWGSRGSGCDTSEWPNVTAPEE